MRWLWLFAAGCQAEDLARPRPAPASTALPPISATSPTASPPGEGATQVGSEGTECVETTSSGDPLPVLLFWPSSGASGVPIDTEILLSPQAPLDDIAVTVSIGGAAVSGRTERMGLGPYRLVRFVPDVLLPSESEISVRASATSGYGTMDFSFFTGDSLASPPGEVRLAEADLVSDLGDFRQLDFTLDIRDISGEFATVRVQAEDCSDTRAEILGLGRLPEDANGDLMGFDYRGRGPDTDCFCAVIRSVSGVESEPSDLLCLE